ncbi:MAG TPA: hypothetical protein VHU43_04335 [Steroidobacteraceae bacterium]|jgi:hypothetical protein|nr:hypothetical protein [Steroidobacteraceae bacterium]
MHAKMRSNYSGSFLAQSRGNGAWHLSRPAPHEMTVILRNAEPGAAQAFAVEPIAELGIEWHADEVLLTFLAGDKVASVEAMSAIVHEPLPHLYESLPLASIDADARRFWHRVFRLVRIPGGRYLLKLLTRSGKRQ